MRRALTPLQRKALEAFRTYTRNRGAPPTVRELGELLGTGRGTALLHLQALVRKGHLVKGKAHAARVSRLLPDRTPGTYYQENWCLECERVYFGKAHECRNPQGGI